MPLTSAALLANDEERAKEYLLSRKEDTETLVFDIGFQNLNYVLPIGQPDGTVMLFMANRSVRCATSLCAVAYVLAHYW